MHISKHSPCHGACSAHELSFLFSFSSLFSFLPLFIFTSLHLSSSSSLSLFISVSLDIRLSLCLSLSSFSSHSLFVALACGGFKKERTLCVQLSVGSPNLAIHNARHVSLFPSALFEPAKTTTVSDRPSSLTFVLDE